MGKIALLVSKEEMIHQAHNIMQEKHYNISEMRVIRTADTVTEARSSISAGATIIIARGLQASIIRQYTEVPVVDIVLTAQEMALLVVKAKQIIKKEKPVIAVIGFKNMFCDMSYFDSIYDIELRTYFAEDGSRLRETALKAIQDKADLVIGGDTVVSVANESDTPSLFLSNTEDSLKNAFMMAESMDYAMGIEKKNAAQLETLLDSTFNGVIKMDCEGIITMVNPFMENMLEVKENAMTGKNITEIIPDIDLEAIKKVVLEEKEYSAFLQLKNTSVFAIMSPILLEHKADGIILNCHKMRKTPIAGDERGGKKNTNHHIILTQFRDILQKSKPMRECIRLAKLYSMSEKPVVIMGEAGTEKLMIAQSIHNNSTHGEFAFIDVPCDGLNDEAQRIGIFGEKGAAVAADGGSLLIQDADKLTASNQYRLYQLIRYKLCNDLNNLKPRKLNVRVMVTTGDDLGILTARGSFRMDLYYLLSGLVLKIPPLRERKEDLKEKLEESVMESCEYYSRYHVLTAGAWKILLDYPWNGNLFQIENFCEYLILTAEKRSIDEIAVNRAFRELYPENIMKSITDNSSEGVMMSTRESESAQRLRKCLEKNEWNRELTAKEMGISKATLWRRMKKYEIK